MDSYILDLGLHDWVKFATTTTVHRLTCGEMLSDEVILERRNGPRRLSDNDEARGHLLFDRGVYKGLTQRDRATAVCCAYV